MASEEKLDKILEELELNTDIIKSQLEATQALLQESANPNHKIKFEKTILKIKELSQIEVKTSSNASRKMSHVASENTNGNSGSVWFPKSFEDFLKKPFNIDKGISDVEMQPCKQGCAIHPLSLFVQIWRSLYSCLIVLYVAILPIGIGVPQEAHILLPITLLHTFLVSLDSIITINTGIIADQELEMDRRVVWRHHWKQKYLLKRFLVGFPYALVVDLSTQAGSLSRFDWRALSLINGLSIVQLLQSTDASYLSEKATQIIRIREINPTMVKFVYILVAIIFYWHYFTCAIAFANVNGFIPDLLIGASVYDHYVFNFYNSASLMFTAGFGVNGPVENQDRWSKILNMIFSAFLLSLFTANITTYMIRLDSSGRQFNEKLEEVNQYIQYRGLGRGLQERIIQYYHFKYSKGKYFDEEKILAELNQPLRVSICMRECRALILQVPFFRDASHSFLTQVVTALEICHFLADDIIIEEGTAGDQMFFISSGFVHVLIGEKVFRTLTAGQYFGEISLLFGNMKRTATIVASTDCVVYSLSQSDLDLILEFNPVMAKAMKDTAINRLKENKVKFEIPTEKSLPVQIIDQSFTRPLPIIPDHKRPSLQIESVKVPVKEDSKEHEENQEKDSNDDILEAAVEEAIQLSINNYRRRTSVQPFIDLSFINKVESNVPHESNGSNDVLELQPNAKRSNLNVPKSNERKPSLVLNLINEELSDMAKPPAIESAESKPEVPASVQRRRSKTISNTKQNFKPTSGKYFGSNPTVQQESTGVDIKIHLDPTEKQENVEITLPSGIQRSHSRDAHIQKEDGRRLSVKPSANKKDSSTKSFELQSDENRSSATPKRALSSDSTSKPIQKSPSGNILSSNAIDAQSPTGKEEIQINLDEMDDLDMPQKVKPARKKVEENLEIDAKAPLKKRSFLQEVDFLWNKYKPSTTYCPLTPQLLFTKIWNSIIDVILCVIVILLPIPFGFSSMEYMLPQLSIVNLIISILDFMVKLQTGHLHHQEIEMEPKKLISIYSRDGTFLFDFLTGFPWVFIIDALTVNNHTLRVWLRIICIINGCAIIRSLTARDRYSYLSEALTDYIRKYDINSSAVQAGKIVLVMAFYWHWRSCMYNLLVRNGAIPNVNPDYFDFDNFTIHFFNSATEMLNAGCGATQPKVNVDRWATVVNFIFNVTLMSLFVGNVSSFMIGLDSSGRQFNEQLEQVTQYITYKGLGRELKSKILAYYQLKYSKGKYFDEAKILSELNHPLRLAIYMRECRALIIQVPFFKGADNGFISQVVMILKPAHFLPDDLVMEKGTAGDLMYFIASGNLDVYIDNKLISHLSPGQFFGEIALLFGNMKRTATVKAVTSCSLYSLSRSDLNFILEVYPEMAEKMQVIAEERLANNQYKKV